MSPTINGSSEFSQCSLDQMEAFLGTRTASCVAAVGPEGVDFSGLASSLSITVDSSRRLNFEIVNDGPTEISGITLALSFAGPLELLDAPPECDLIARSATCVPVRRPGGRQQPARQPGVHQRASSPRPCCR